MFVSIYVIPLLIIFSTTKDAADNCGFVAQSLGLKWQTIE